VCRVQIGPSCQLAHHLASVHVNWPGGLAGATWPLHDPNGYTEAEKSMCAYGRANFSEYKYFDDMKLLLIRHYPGAAECKLRALPVEVNANQMDDGIEPEGSTVPLDQDRERNLSTSPAPPLTFPDLPHLMPAPQDASSLPTTSSITVSIPESAVLQRRPTATPEPEPRQDAATPGSPKAPIRADSILPAPAMAVPVLREESPILRSWRRAAATPEPEQRGDDSAANPDTPNNPPDPHPIGLPSPATTLNNPPDTSGWPQHMVDANNYFTMETVVTDDVSVVNARNWGDVWLSCLQNFIEFQRSAGFPDTGLSFPPATKIRPPEIGVWMKNRRLWKDVVILDKGEFGRQWWDWWISLQPGSRTCTDRNNVALPTVDMDWSNLRKPGKNGFLLIMLSLVWWGKVSDTDSEWLKAVTDVTAVLSCMHDASSMGSAINQPSKRGPLTNSTAANTASNVASKRPRGADEVEAGMSKKRRTRR
jgi:hypothetical protein